MELDLIVVAPDAGAVVKTAELPRGQTHGSVLSATIHPDIKRILVGMSERTGMTVSQVADRGALHWID